MPYDIMKKVTVGVLMLDHNLTRPPGDPGNAATFPFPVIHATVSGVSLQRLLDKDPGILDPLTHAAQKLEESGVAVVTSGCGFFIYFQQFLSSRLHVPVILSSLLQIPLIQQSIGPDRRIGVLTAHSGRLTREHLLLAGMDPHIPVKTAGLENEPHFKQGILTNKGSYSFNRIQDEVVAKARTLVEVSDGGPPVGAILMECTNLPPFAAVVQETLGLPVFDITTLIHSFYSALTRTRFY
ncbi:MAG: aspartate/glutamate racemase family protein [Thermodesulfobacteriota bacterium]